ncbi:MAG: M20/M25/M40 family metallo-hydrolase [Acidobacteriota bacterium]|nr:M20/M25/M40 family metallo-hydrolase [Blastocatellia bacterium]MDW8413145.1 M20/M25/M40 family metallo-hydrolase [Acidobacteriota bacterium]
MHQYPKLDEYIESIRPQFEERLAAFVEIPTVSMDPEHRADIDRGADLAVELLKEIGVTAEKAPTDGYPCVVGELIQDRRYQTVTIYNHLDVQPADPAEWQQEPFKFTKEGDRYGGRGTTDDKGPALTALYAVRYAVEQHIPLNFRFLWELEEEIGSPNFDSFLKSRAKTMKTNSVVISDTVWINRSQPAVPYGLRGLLTLTFTLETGTKDVHSGLTGGAARNPIGELCKLIDQCYDATTGRVKIPGFYEDVVPLKKEQLESFLASGFDLEHFCKAHGLKSLRSNDAATVIKAIMSRPTFEVHGITGGYVGAGVKTIVPYRAEAKISCRLVNDMKVDKTFKLIKKFVKAKNPDVQVIAHASSPPYLGQFEGKYADAAREAMRYAFGKTPAFTREGGTIGACTSMEKYLKVPLTFLGLSLPEHGYHAPNENYDWQQTCGGIKMFTRYFDIISRF